MCIRDRQYIVYFEQRVHFISHHRINSYLSFDLATVVKTIPTKSRLVWTSPVYTDPSLWWPPFGPLQVCVCVLNTPRTESIESAVNVLCLSSEGTYGLLQSPIQCRIKPVLTPCTLHLRAILGTTTASMANNRLTCTFHLRSLFHSILITSRPPVNWTLLNYNCTIVPPCIPTPC